MNETEKLKQHVTELIGRNIRELRTQKHMTQDKLSEAANVSEKHLSAIENCRIENISILYLIDIASALDVDYKELLKNRD